MGGCQNYGPLTALNICSTQKGTIILGTTHIMSRRLVLVKRPRVSSASAHRLQILGVVKEHGF